MRLFISKTFFLLLPLLIIFSIIEYGLRTIPNDYEYKCEYLISNASEIEVLILGSSHSYRGINPDILDYNSFNAAYVSQTLDYDYAIWEKFSNKLNSLKYIILPISYFTLFSRLEENQERWRTKNYTIYFGLPPSNSEDYFEILSNKASVNLEKFTSFYLDKTNPITCSDKGWGGVKGHSEKDIIVQSKAAIRRHTSKTNKWLEPNVKLLQDLILTCSKNNIQILMVSLPAHKGYSSLMDSVQWNTTLNEVNYFVEEYDHVDYLNFISHQNFTLDDFYDSDHLNENGAKKLTQLINCHISKNRKK